MCPDCGGEYGHADWCPALARYSAQRAAARPLEEKIEALEKRLRALSGIRNIAWATLDLIGNPGTETAKLDPRALAREALDKIRAAENGCPTDG